MMLKIIQINSFLFLFIGPSAISWTTVNGAICCYLTSMFLAHAALKQGLIHIVYLGVLTWCFVTSVYFVGAAAGLSSLVSSCPGASDIQQPFLSVIQNLT